MSSETNDQEERWRALAAEARATAAQMVDAEARRLMINIAAGYEHLADRAKARKDQKHSK